MNFAEFQEIFVKQTHFQSHLRNSRKQSQNSGSAAGMAEKAKKRIYTEIELDKIYKGEVKLDDKGKAIHKRRQQSREQDREEKGNAC